MGNTDKIFHLKFGETMSHLSNTKLSAFRLELIVNPSSDERIKKIFDDFQEAAGIFEMGISKLFDEIVLKKVRNQKG